MHATLRWLGALCGVMVLASCASAQQPFHLMYPRIAPDACGPGFYSTNQCGALYGPGYCLQPPFPPWNGFHPSSANQAQQQGIPAFPTHPFARSPRDYFMMEQ